ncbi:MAG: Holliday junction branch migration protein RuvA [Candidatus Uhrbacteria bacterium]|nr:Holliday junction branch migration protein RuvA [Patescibacteria group bacterium]
MITTLSGTIIFKSESYVVIEVAGVGYKVTLTPHQVSGLNGEVTMYTHEAIRETEHELFGFFSMNALELFWKLIAVSGVGPKVGQKIVSSDEVDNVKAKIMAGDLSFLTNIPGVGTKTAQKIILELKGALADDNMLPAVDQDAVDALTGLGISKKEAQEVLTQVEADSTDERIRAALKQLGK